MADKVRKTPKLLIGTVEKKAMQKSATLRIDYMGKHPLYGKISKRSKKLIFHDENDECQIGDRVSVMETRPLSKLKKHRLVQVLERCN